MIWEVILQYLAKIRRLYGRLFVCRYADRYKPASCYGYRIDKLYPVYITGIILVSFPTQWSRTQSGSRNNSCDRPLDKNKL